MLSWDEIETSDHWQTFVARVPGGLLFRVRYLPAFEGEAPSIAMAFVPTDTSAPDVREWYKRMTD